MGYSEKPCRLCGVSFNVGRIRQPREPRSEGWTQTGDGRSFHQGSGSCTAENGCRLVKRRIELNLRNGLQERKMSLELPSDDDEDEYLDGDEEEEMEDEQYEFESDDDLAGQLSSGCDDVETESRSHEKDWLHGLLSQPKAIPEAQEFIEEDELLPLDYLTEKQLEEDKQEIARNSGPKTYRIKYEHIAGPTCHLGGSAYSGNNITAEEMEGCNTLQCLTRKSYTWEAELDDLDFELQSDYFLSGLSDHMPSRDSSDPIVMPARHGLRMPNADTMLWDNIPASQYSMPFHPPCLDIFMRISRLHFDHIDINRLMQWYVVEGGYAAHITFPYSSDVVKSSQQWWDHRSGLEYLAANPLFIPSLEPILRAAIHTEESFNSEHSAFEIPNSVSHHHNTRSKLKPYSEDPFSTLPAELRLQILSHLSSRSIANLRLCSRSFRHLPISLFRQLLCAELPWLWEVWSKDSPYLWATVTPAQMEALAEKEKAKMEAREAEDERLQFIRNVIGEEMPELLDFFDKREKELLENREDLVADSVKSRKRVAAFEGGLPPHQTNWYEVYCGITRNWKDLKGLRNRERIWKDCEEIARRITWHHEEGRIV